MRYAEFVPDLPPVAVCELTDRGWRGLTEDGEVLEVADENGGVARPSDSIAITSNGKLIGFRAVPPPSPEGAIGDYLFHFNAAIQLLRDNKPGAALREIDLALRRSPTVRAKFNRALILLSMGRWPEGFDEYVECEQNAIFARPLSQRAISGGLRAWRGENVAGKRLLLIHDHGFGDTIMTLRHVRALKDMGADVVMVVPRELQRLARQCGAVVDDLCDADYFCPMLHLLGALRLGPQHISLDPYLTVDDKLIDKWNAELNNSPRKTVGVAWSVGVANKDDYPREISLPIVAGHFGKEVTLVSVQKQGADEARTCGVEVIEFDDFADCAALMLLLDQVVSIDTATLHLAGAIGHPNVVGLLSHWHSWRWLSPLYKNVKLCRQAAPDDWKSALAGVMA
jgi:hypothetical protein